MLAITLRMRAMGKAGLISPNPLGGERDENEVVDLYKSTLGK